MLVQVTTTAPLFGKRIPSKLLMLTNAANTLGSKAAPRTSRAKRKVRRKSR